MAVKRWEHLPKYDPNFTNEENYAIILFTILHEIAHIMTPSVGHDSNFWQNFQVIKPVVSHRHPLTGW